MKRYVEIGILVAALLAIAAFGYANRGGPVSVHSTFDTGPNGYEAIYNVLRDEGVPASRWTAPYSELPANVAVVVETTYVFYGTKRELANFTKRGGRVVTMNDARFENGTLERRPQNATIAYRLLAGRGDVVFDERPYGYVTGRTMWSVLPGPVRLAAALAVLALLLALVPANIRFAPAVVREPPADRDSYAYIESMARLLKRARASHLAYPGKDQS